MSKRYRLLKDIDSPNVVATAGDIGEWHSDMYYFDNGRYSYEDWRVEKSTEWFEVIPESKPQDTFTWTDNLVSEYAKYVNGQEHVYGRLSIMDRFKQSKTQQPKEQGISIVNIDFDCHEKWINISLDKIYLSKHIPSIKEAIEKILNH